MRVAYKETALEQLEALPVAARKRIINKVVFFISQPDPLVFAKPLRGHDAYRFRIGNYRVVFDIEKDVLTVLLVVKREGAYRNL